MSESGRSCRMIDRRSRLADELFDVRFARDKVIVRVRGRRLTGAGVLERGNARR